MGDVETEREDGVGEESAVVAEAVPAAEDRQPTCHSRRRPKIDGDTSRVNRTVTFNDDTSRVYRTVTVNDFDGCMRYESDDDSQAQEGNTQEGTYAVRRTEEYSYPDSDEDSVNRHTNPSIPL